ncbi:MAG TPA: ester cyclase [Nitrososphaeraceae archaeon]|jgi:predicted ester cyclase
MSNNETMSQIEKNKAVIKRYFEAYNNKDEGILDEIIDPEYVDHGQSAYMGSPGKGVAGAKHDLENSLDKLNELNYVVEAMVASEAYPDLVGAYWKGSLTPKATYSDTPQTNKIISYRGISIYRIQNGKMVETWHVFDGLPMKLLST